jgi:predicted DNA-binding protein
MARPTKHAKDRQSEVIAVRLTPAEYRALAKVSKTTGMKESEVVRRCINEGLRGVEIYARKHRKDK